MSVVVMVVLVVKVVLVVVAVVATAGEVLTTSVRPLAMKKQ